MSNATLQNTPNATSQRKWYVLRAKPRSDDLAVRELANAGFQAFSLKSTITRPGYIATEESSVFPGYIFIKCCLEDDQKPALSITPHVSHWINFDGDIINIPDETIYDLKTLISQWKDTGGVWYKFHAGEKVEITMANVTVPGEVLESTKSPYTKVRVLLNFINSQIPAEIPYGMIQQCANNIKPPRRTRGKRRWINKNRPDSRTKP